MTFLSKLESHLANGHDLDFLVMLKGFAYDHEVQAPPKQAPPHKPGFWHWVASTWVSLPVSEVRTMFNFDVVVLDFEAKEISPKYWEPTCCSVYSQTHGWIWWWAEEGARFMPFSPEAMKIGHNAVAYDRKYLESEYNPPLHGREIDIDAYSEANPYPGIVRGWADTMQLAQIIGGAGGEDVSGGKSGGIRELWLKFQRQLESGLSVPEWHTQTHRLSLDYLTEKFLGVKHSKTVRDEWVKDPTAVQPESLYEYCVADTHLTALLFQRLFSIVDKQFIRSPVSWYGMHRTSQQVFHLEDWDGFIAESEKDYEAAILEINAFQDRAVANAMKCPEKFPDFDWGRYIRGANKGKYKWTEKVTDKFNSDVAVQCALLTFDGHPVRLEKKGRGAPIWWANGNPLPHPDGDGQNLGSPLCKDYRPLVVDGRLQSEVFTQDELLKIFDLRDSVTQWVSYRERYRLLYRKEMDGNPDVSISFDGLNDCGTISRRTTSKVWVVLPKPNEAKVGSQVMSRIIAPPGYKFVSADFVSQESRIATAPLTDARAGQHNSSPWSEAVLSGDKSQKTDVHSMTATQLGISRDNAKGINFLLQYQGGLNLLTNTLVLLKSITHSEAEKLASDFMKRLKGRGGIAETTFRNINFCADKSDLRTYLLGVKQPNTLNPRYVRSVGDRSFATVRGNWPIQSAGVDEKHTLIALIDIIANAKGLGGQFTFACEIHDQIVYLCKEEHAPTLAKIFDAALGKLMAISYEQAALFWDEVDPLPQPRPVLTPDPKWCKFEQVIIADNLAECK